jgi:hypothetical protein
MLSREFILSELKNAVEPLPFALAMWEGGAASFGRVDEWSDIDVQFDVKDDHVEDTLGVIEQVLQSLSPFEIRFRLPEPTWHGHAQVFYRLQDAGPFLMVDLVIMKHSNPDKFLEREIHGPAIFYFDKIGLQALSAGGGQQTVVKTFDEAAWQQRLQGRKEYLLDTFSLFQPLTLKELPRGNHIEALAFYMGYTVRPLVEALRIRYAPRHHHFSTRYIYYDLPAEVVQRLERLYFVADASEIAEKRAQAEEWFYEITRDWSKSS